MKQIVILGAGPSGLMAAHAVAQRGYRPRLLDVHPIKPDGQTAGVFYLHAPCDLEIMCEFVSVSSVGGSAETYCRKVYGDSATAIYTSFPTQSKIELVYDGMGAMGLLWDRYEPYIERTRPLNWEDVVGPIALDSDLVINTIPLDLLTGMRMPFARTWVYTVDQGGDEAFVHYDGRPEVPWYRISNIFGRMTTEFVPGIDPRSMIVNTGIGKLRNVRKVINAPDLIPSTTANVFLTGRYGSWDKHCLTHNVYERVHKRLDALQ